MIRIGFVMLLSVAGAPADASALAHFQQAHDSESQLHRWSFLLGKASLPEASAMAFDRTLAVRTVARQLKPLAKQGWLVLPSIRFEGCVTDEIDFFLLSPSGQAYALLVQRYARARMKVSGTEAYGNGYRDSLPQAVQDRAERIRMLLKEKDVPVIGLTPTAVLVDVEKLRYWGPRSVLVTPDWKLIRALRKRERLLQKDGSAKLVRDERLLSQQFWGEEANFSLEQYQRDLNLHRRVASRLVWGRAFQHVWISILVGAGAGLAIWLYLGLIASQPLPIMIMN